MNDNFLIKRGHFTPLAILLMILLPLVTALICICLGRMNVPVGDVITVFRDVFTGNEGHAQNYSIVINLRLPRILMAIIVGAGLTCAGNTFQSLFSNPLATPDILGVTSGTCVGAILAGAVCGDHISPISDTTILSSAGAQCRHIDHVSTQMPYALTVALCASIGYILSGITGNGYIGLAAASASLAVVMVIIVMTAKRGR